MSSIGLMQPSQSPRSPMPRAGGGTMIDTYDT